MPSPTQNLLSHFQRVVSDISRFNEDNGATASVGNFLSGLVGAVTSGSRNVDLNSETLSRASLATTKAEAIFKTHFRFLSDIGLEIDTGKGTQLHGPGGRLSETLSLGIADASKLTNFLRSLSPRMLETEDAKFALRFLHTQTVAFFNSLAPHMADKDHRERLFDGLQEVTSEYNRLGFKDEAKQLGTLLEHAWRGDLVEYLAVQQSGYLTPVGQGFSPSTWQIDCSAASYQKNWDAALETLRIIGQNPKAAVLAVELRQHLQECCAYAMVEVRSAMQNPDLAKTSYWSTHGAGFQETLRNVKAELEIIEES